MVYLLLARLVEEKFSFLKSCWKEWFNYKASVPYKLTDKFFKKIFLKISLVLYSSLTYLVTCDECFLIHVFTLRILSIVMFVLRHLKIKKS